MKNLVRTAAMSLTTVVALATMTACGGSDGSASDATSAAPSSTSASTDATSPSTSASAGTSDGASTPATTTPPVAADSADFCATFAAIPAGLNGTDPTALVDAAHQFADSLAGATVPSDMPADAQNGLKAYISTLQGLDEGDVAGLQEMSDLSQLFGDDTADVSTFITYVTTTCADVLASAAPSASATAVPTSPATP